MLVGKLAYASGWCLASIPTRSIGEGKLSTNSCLGGAFGGQWKRTDGRFSRVCHVAPDTSCRSDRVVRRRAGGRSEQAEGRTRRPGKGLDRRRGAVLEANSTARR